MRFRFRPLHLAMILVAASPFPVMAGQAAATADSEDTEALPEVTVTTAPAENAYGPVDGYVAKRSATATKTDTPLLETPQSISVISREQLDKQDPDTVGEALRYSAGIKGESFGLEDRGFDSFIDIRGFSSPVFRDGLLINTPGFSGLNNEVYLAERIEILRGPASVLYGKGTPGGIVNLVSKRPLDTPLRELIVEAGSFDHYAAKFDVGDLIQEDASLAYRLTGLVSNSNAQVDFIDRERAVVAPSLTWRPSDATTLTFLSSFNRDDLGASSNSFLPARGTVMGNPNGRISPHRFTGEPAFNTNDREQYSLGYLLEHHFGPQLNFRQNVRYDNADLDFRGLFGGGLDPSDPTERRLARFSFSALTDTQVISIDNQLQLDFSTGPAAHSLLFGLDYQALDFDQQAGFGFASSLDLYDPQYGSAVATPPLFEDSTLKQRQTGFYVQDQIKLQEKYILQLGGRYDTVRSDRKERIFDGRERQDDQEFTGRIGLVYLAGNGLAPYVNYAESFLPVVGTPAPGHSFKPETGDQYEVGVKYQPAGTNALLTLAAFDARRQNVVTANGLFQDQSGEQRSRGIEAEAVASLSSGLDIKAAYTYLDIETTENNGVNEGKTPTGQARHRASLRTDYTIKGGQLRGLGIGAGVRYVGESYGDDANTFKVDSFTLFDASLSYDWQRFRLALNAQNLFDREYIERCFGETGCFYGSVQRITASLRYRLD